MKPEIKWTKLAEIELFADADPLNIEKLVCDFFEVNEKILHSKSRMRPLPTIRFIVWRIRYVFYGRSLCFLAQEYEVTHNAILYGKNKALQLPEYKKFLKHLLKNQ